MYECPYCEAEFESPVLEKEYNSGEFWGARFHESNCIACCPECGEELDEIDPREIAYDRECDRADYLYDCRRDDELMKRWEEENE